MTDQTRNADPPPATRSPDEWQTRPIPDQPTIIPGETVHRLPQLPVHLWQRNDDPGVYSNPMGCGAFSTAMALSCYDPATFGSNTGARTIFDQMLKVPFFGGTFEGQNAVIARKYNYYAKPYDHGVVSDLTAAIDLGAPTILLLYPKPVLRLAGRTLLSFGQHDVLLVGYSVDAGGRPLKLFINNPWNAATTQAAPPGLDYPGNQTLTIATLAADWTGCFTPVFPSIAVFTRWRVQTHRG